MVRTVLPSDLEDSQEATAHHEAGHAMLHRLLRGHIQHDATMEPDRFDKGSAAPDCHGDTPFIGEICGDDYCRHEVWDALAGPVAEWIFRRQAGVTSRELLPWMHSLSTESLARVGPNQLNRDEFTSAIHRYCVECLCAFNTLTSSDGSHPGAHSVRAVAHEAEIVTSIVSGRWECVTKLAQARLASADAAISGSLLASLLDKVPESDVTEFNESKARRDRDEESAATSLDLSLEVLRTLPSLFEASSEVTRQEFRAFVRDGLSRHSSIFAFIWAKLVFAAERSAFERAARAEGYPKERHVELTGTCYANRRRCREGLPRRVDAEGPFKVRSLAVSERVEVVLRTVLVGGGATLVMDGWVLLLRRFGIPSLNFAFLGRWLGNLPEEN